MKAIVSDRIFFTSLFFFLTSAGYGQIMTEIKSDTCNLALKDRKVLQIQEVILQDTFLVRQIELIIQEEISQDSIFRSGMGYIILHTNAIHPSQVSEENIWRSYYVKAQYVELENENIDAAFPPFYAYVGQRLVLIHISLMRDINCYRYSKKSRRALQRKLEPFMPKTEKLVGRDENGKVDMRDKHFRLTRFAMHNGKYIYLYTDKPPKVFYDPDGRRK